jgi:uncharacterized protein YjbJ (UPF0337 family)
MATIRLVATTLSKEHPMDKDRVIGSAKVVKGKAKVAVGKAIGDAKLVAEGEAEKIKGKSQNAVGSIKDKIRDA